MVRTTVYSTVNAAYKTCLDESELADFIKTDKFPERFREHIYVFFTEVSNSAIMKFCNIYGIKLEELEAYYNRHVRDVYRNRELEEMFGR
jgi:hypothetical protein